jgi:type I restriction enzyme, S subunit
MNSNWEIKKLSDVCNFQNGFAFKSNTFRDSGTPVVRITNIKNGKIDISKIIYINPLDYDNDLTKYEIINNDLLIAMSGATTGKIGVYEGTEKLLLNQRVGNFKPKNNLLKEYLFYFLSTKVEENLLISVGSAQPNLSTSQINNFLIPIPSLEEQKQIVEILDTAFEALEKAKTNLEKNLKNTKELFDSKLNEIFSQKGEGWEEKTLGEVCLLIKRGIPPKYIEENGLTVINQKCIRNHKINLELSRLHDSNLKSVSEEKLIKIGDVLINSTGTGTLGRVAQVRNIKLEGCTVDTHVTIVRPDSDLFYMDFFGYALIKIESEIEKSGEGTSGQTELARTKLQNYFLINYPNCKNLQKEIVLILDSLVLKTKQLEKKYQQKLDNLEELKKSLLQKAFSGELTN